MKRKLCQLLAFVSLLALFGVVGGIEHGGMDLLSGCLWGAGALAGLAGFAKLGRMYYQPEQKEKRPAGRPSHKAHTKRNHLYGITKERICQ